MQVVTFDSANRIRCVSISIVSDSVGEETERFTGVLSTDDPRVILQPDTITVVILEPEGKYHLFTCIAGT